VGSRFGPEHAKALTRALKCILATLRVACVAFVICLPLTVLSTTLDAAEEAEQSLEKARKAIAARSFDQAELQLERVLMLVPEHAEARVILASLMAQLGRLETALLLLQSLIDDPRTEDDYRQRLRGIYALIAQAPRLASSTQMPDAMASDPDKRGYWRGEIGLGHSSNPLARTAASELPLTIADSVINLPLSDRPIRGNQIQASIARLGPDQGFDLNLTSVSLSGGQIGHAAAGRVSAWGAIAGPLYWQAQAQQSLDDQRRYTFGLSLAEGRNRLTLAAFREPTRGETGQFLRYEHRVLPLAGGLWSAGIERGHHTEQTPDYLRASITGEYNLGKQRFLVVNWGYQGDLSGYNPLLENNSRRWLETRSVAFERHFVLGTQKVVVLRALANERRSNLTIFSFRDLGLQVSLLATWL